MDRAAPLAALALLGAVGGTPPLAGQHGRGLRLGVTLGVQQFSLSDVKDAYGSLVQLYQGSGVAVPIEREFPANLLVGVELTRRMAPSVVVGLSADYTWTRAFALYGDTTGRLDLTSTVKLTTVLAVARFAPGAATPRPFYVELRAGLGHGSLKFAQFVHLLPPIDARTSELLSASGTGPTLEAALGAESRLAGLRVGAALGYRYAKIGQPRGKDVVDGQVVDEANLPFDLNPSGLVVRLRIGR